MNVKAESHVPSREVNGSEKHVKYSPSLVGKSNASDVFCKKSKHVFSRPLMLTLKV